MSGAHEGCESAWASFEAKAAFPYAVATGASGLLVAYALWLTRGCVAMPFISDLGLRPPEQRVFQFTLCAVVPVITILVASESVRQLMDLKMAGKPLVLWFATVAAGVMSVIGAFVAGFTPWDWAYHAHLAGAVLFFAGGLGFVVGMLAVWTQLGHRRPGVPAEGAVAWILFCVPLGTVSATIGLALYMKYGPLPPCGIGAVPVSGECIPASARETFFDELCFGDKHTHSTIGGNVSAFLEWLVFACIVTSCMAIVRHGSGPGRRGSAPLVSAIQQLTWSTRRASAPIL